MKKTSVLIVDDSEEDRYLLKREILDTDLDVEFFEEKDGEDALAFFNAYKQIKINIR